MVPLLIAAKLALHDAMLAGGVSNVALAKRLGVDEKQVRRMINPLLNSRMSDLERALKLLGKRVEIVINDDLAVVKGGMPMTIAERLHRIGEVIKQNGHRRLGF